MLDWDDVRYLLAVARNGSVRAAAEQLHVNHSTVLRRVAQLEHYLGAQMFERLPSGYRLTDAGEEVLEFAEGMEAASNGLQVRVFGRDQGVRGVLRVTLPPVVAGHLLMKDFVEFAKQYPEVEVEILSVDEPVNLANREADVAIRNVYDREALPHNLYGQMGPDVYWSVYIAPELLAAYQRGEMDHVRWVIKNKYGHPAWCRETDIPAAEVFFRTTDAAAQILAAQQGVGMTLLPCFVGDTDPQLVRVPGARVHMHGTLWLLTLGETRKTKRVRVFSEFIARRLAQYQPLLAGQARPLSGLEEPAPTRANSNASAPTFDLAAS